MLSDIEIAHLASILPSADIAEKAGINRTYLEPFGNYKAKVGFGQMAKLKNEKDGRLVLVTAVNPTPAGEGKTTATIGIADAFSRLGKRTMAAIREPSLGPVFGAKGGAAGGGYAQVIPMEDINLHFTGDMHAVGVANNLLAAMLDNHMYHGNALGIDSRKITWKRCIDMNDRQLRNIMDGLLGIANGVPREDGFDITAASEVMAVLCLSDDLEALKDKLKKIVVGYTHDGMPVTAGELKAHGAMASVLRDAMKPNLVQTLEHTPVFVHGGPFANIAHGCNSISATKLALKLSEYVITEAGFGADLGAEKFFDIKCRMAGLHPSAAVVVATMRALKHHGGVPTAELAHENIPALHEGMKNLKKHVDNIQNVFGLPAVVALNRFPSDTQAEIDAVKALCEETGAPAVVCEVWAKGGEGGIALAEKIMAACEAGNDFRYAYELDMPIKNKIETIAKRIYGAEGVDFLPAAVKTMEHLEELGFGGLPICMAKTQFSLSDDAHKYGCPEGFHILVRDMKVSAGAGFVVAFTGEIVTMPGLPKSPNAERIDVDNAGVISGLF
ncbi:MAG: formate--tetrahydrofolate ligase [Bacillota bacterium]|nr:formate--tetrahydrofolate ligase [Bacillota bacterium]